MKKDDPNKIGKFGMGRGQIFSKGVVTYKTKYLVLNVDVKNRGLNYSIETKKSKSDKVDGCEIVIELYESLDWRIDNLISNLEKSTLFKDFNLYINDKKVKNLNDFNKKDIEIVGNTTFVKTGETFSPKIYIKGMYIQTTSILCEDGVYILNDLLDVNFARNDVIEDEVYRTFVKEVEDINLKFIKTFDKRKSFTDTSKIYENLKNGTLEVKDIENIKFIKSFEGEVYHTFKNIYGYGAINVQDLNYSERFNKGNIIKNNLSNIVIDISSSEMDILTSKGLDIIYAKKAIQIYEVLSEIFKKVEKPAEIADVTKKLTKKYLYFIENHLNELIADSANKSARTIKFVQNAKYDACTDGCNYININIDMIKPKMKVLEVINKIGLTLLHEYCHETDSLEADHATDFLQRYHDLSFDACMVIGQSFKVFDNWKRHFSENFD